MNYFYRKTRITFSILKIPFERVLQVILLWDDQNGETLISSYKTHHAHVCCVGAACFKLGVMKSKTYFKKPRNLYYTQKGFIFKLVNLEYISFTFTDFYMCFSTIRQWSNYRIKTKARKQAPVTYRTGYAIQLVSLPNFTALLHKVKLQTNISNKQKKAHINPNP